jgi:hypothetical protein
MSVNRLVEVVQRLKAADIIETETILQVASRSSSSCPSPTFLTTWDG